MLLYDLPPPRCRANRMTREQGIHFLTLGVLLSMAACAPAEPSSRRITATCSFKPAGPDVYVKCANGTWFIGPGNGGLASGQDVHGNEVFADVVLESGRYRVVDIVPTR